MDTIGLDDFYKDAMEFFIESGHAVTSVPIYFNHSVKQVIYFDTKRTILIDNHQRRDLEYATNVSHLFDISDDLFVSQIEQKVSYYSIVLECEMNSRSQIACEVHMLLHPAFDTDMSVVLFKHCCAVVVSIFGTGMDLMLSDWCNINSDYTNFIDRMHIANLNLTSANEFISDLSYNIARNYYFQSETINNSMHNLLPVDYFGTSIISGTHTIDKETIIETIRAIVTATEKVYGDDYVQPASRTCETVDDIDAALNLLSFDLEFDKVDLNDEIIDEDNDESGNYFDDIKLEEESFKDEYEFDEVDPAVFKDATQMLIWLKKNETAK